MTDCFPAEDWLEPSEAARLHLVTCVACQALADDIDAIRGIARALPARGWAGGLPPKLDLEGALAEVLAATTPRRRRRAPAVLRLASSLAAAALLCSAAAPSLLQWRLESSPTTAHAPQAFAPVPSSIFWTTKGSP